MPSPALSREQAPGRLGNDPPLAVIDIGSNSVRLVVYERLTRSPTPLFNEKVLCGLATVVAAEGRITKAAAERVFAALRRFRALCDEMEVGELFVLATAAARNARNGAEFIAETGAICGCEVHLLSGREEAEMSALGVVSGIHDPRGVVGDLGGGSLELVEVAGERIGMGVSLPLGGLVLQSAAHDSVKAATALVRSTLTKAPPLKRLAGQTFYAVGGTWRALARLHMAETKYPLRVMHGYTLSADEARAFAAKIAALSTPELANLSGVSSGRRPLLAYGAVVLEQIMRIGKPRQVMLSALGVREGHLFQMLDRDARRADPLVSAAEELGFLRARSPRHDYELVTWTDRLFDSLALNESDAERRLRHAACHLADIGWRAHPDYRGEQSFDLIANAAFIGVDHPGRAYLALAIYFRHEGSREGLIPPGLRDIAGERLVALARILGASFRVAYLLSGGISGVLPRIALVARSRAVVLGFPRDLDALASERVAGRLKQLGKLVDRDAVVDIAGVMSKAS
jgi:exopolyphosphatase/guanosine-5'-triphosphate,3'-diphosphate pyrophosphatase